MSRRLLAFLVTLLLPATACATALPESLLRDLAPIDGTVILAVPGQILIDRDAASGVAEGDLFALLAPAAPVIHPATGETLGTSQSVTGWLRVARVRGGYSEATPLTAATKVAVGTRVGRFREAEALLLDPQGTYGTLYPALQAALPQLRWLGYFTEIVRLPAAGATPRLVLTAVGGELEARESASGLLRRYPLAAPGASAVGAQPPPVAPGISWNALSGVGVARAVEIADLDGDKRNETIVATLHGIEIGRFNGQDYEKLAALDLGIGRSILGLDAFDSNGDGVMELWVTAHREADLDSTVLFWDGQTIRTASDHLGWWLRRLNLPASGRTLLAQRMGEEDFTGPIVRIALKGGKIETAPAGLPRQLSLYGLARLKGTDGPLSVRLTPFDRLQVLAENGEVLQEGEETYGGSEAFIPRPDPRRTGSNSDTRNAYAAPRFEAVGSHYLLAPANLGSRAFARQREFKESRLDLLEWDGALLRPLLRGRVETGYLADFRYADLDNDGEKEIVSLLVTARPGLTGKGRYLIVVNETILPE